MHGASAVVLTIMSGLRRLAAQSGSIGGATEVAVAHKIYPFSSQAQARTTQA
jgi:hypothetical protein